MVLELILNLGTLIIFIALGIIFGIHLFQELTGRAPFVPISKDVLSDIVSALEVKDGDVMYDLGSGDGRVVFMVAKSNDKVTAIGVERSFLPHYISKIKKKRKKIVNAYFVRKNFFDIRITDASHVFLYLFPGLMDSLLPKLEAELKPGTRVVSCDFRFSKKAPMKVIYLNRSGGDLGQEIYIYEF